MSNNYDYDCLKYLFNKYFLGFKRYEEEFLVRTLGADNTIGADFIKSRNDEMNSDYSYFMEILNEFRELN